MPRLPGKKKVHIPSPSPSASSSDVEAADNAPDPKAVFSNWSLEECTKLIDHIKTNGYDGDVKKISELFPGHTETNIRHFMSELNQRAGIREEDKTDRDRWNESVVNIFAQLQDDAQKNTLSQSHGSVVPMFVESTANFEKHPAPDSCGGVDYAAMNQCIASLMHGEVPKALNAPTSRKLLQLLDLFLDKVFSPAWTDLPDPGSFKVPVVSRVKSRLACNATLANRRSTKWSACDILKGEELIKADLKRVREIYLATAWANPFRYPDESSPYRSAKLASRKLADKENAPADQAAKPAKTPVRGARAMKKQAALNETLVTSNKRRRK